MCALPIKTILGDDVREEAMKYRLSALALCEHTNLHTHQCCMRNFYQGAISVINLAGSCAKMSSARALKGVRNVVVDY